MPSVMLFRIVCCRVVPSTRNFSWNSHESFVMSTSACEVVPLAFDCAGGSGVGWGVKVTGLSVPSVLGFLFFLRCRDAASAVGSS